MRNAPIALLAATLWAGSAQVCLAQTAPAPLEEDRLQVQPLINRLSLDRMLDFVKADHPGLADALASEIQAWETRNERYLTFAKARVASLKAASKKPSKASPKGLVAGVDVKKLAQEEADTFIQGINMGKKDGFAEVFVKAYIKRLAAGAYDIKAREPKAAAFIDQKLDAKGAR